MHVNACDKQDCMCYLACAVNTGGELPWLSIPNGRRRKPGRDAVLAHGKNGMR